MPPSSIFQVLGRVRLVIDDAERLAGRPIRHAQAQSVGSVDEGAEVAGQLGRSRETGRPACSARSRRPGHTRPHDAHPSCSGDRRMRHGGPRRHARSSSGASRTTAPSSVTGLGLRGSLSRRSSTSPASLTPSLCIGRIVGPPAARDREAILAANEAGASLRKIAAEAKLSHEQVRRIVQAIRRALLRHGRVPRGLAAAGAPSCARPRSAPLPLDRRAQAGRHLRGHEDPPRGQEGVGLSCVELRRR